MIPNLACRYPIDTKEGTWKPYSRRLETGHVVPTLWSIFREHSVKQLKVREEKKSLDFLRALRPSSVVGGQTPSLTGSGRSVRPIQHTPGSCDGGLCVSQCPIIPQAPRAAFCIKGSAGGTRHQTQGPPPENSSACVCVTPEQCHAAMWAYLQLAPVWPMHKIIQTEQAFTKKLLLFITWGRTEGRNQQDYVKRFMLI